MSLAVRVSSYRVFALFLRILRAALPLIVIGVVLANPDRLIDLLTRLVGDLNFVDGLVLLLSTATVRALVALGIFLALLGVGAGAGRLVGAHRRWLAWGVLVPVILVAVAWPYLGTTFAGALLGSLIIGVLCHLRPDLRQFLPGLRTSRSAAWCALGIGVAEILTPRRYLIWLRYGDAPQRPRAKPLNRAMVSPVIGALMIANLISLAMPFHKASKIGFQLFAPASVTVLVGPDYHMFGRADATSLMLTSDREHLYFCGDPQKTVSKISNLNSDRVVEDTAIPSNGSQFCLLLNQDSQILTAMGQTGKLGVFDVQSSDENTIADLSPISGGEILLATLPTENSLIIASEAVDNHVAHPSLRVLAQDTLETRQSFDIDPGYLLTHPKRAMFYVSWFQGRPELLSHDLSTGETRLAPADGRMDRMALDLSRDQLLAVSPVHGRLLIYDAMTLQPTGEIPTVFGARGLAIDPTRDLVLVTSLVTNHVDVIDLHSQKSIHRIRLGPWLRDVVLDTPRGIAYVSSRFGIYRVVYAR